MPVLYDTKMGESRTSNTHWSLSDAKASQPERFRQSVNCLEKPLTQWTMLFELSIGNSTSDPDL